MKRSVNFGGNKTTARRKALRPRNLLATMEFLGMSEDEQRNFLQRTAAGCGCGPNDGCSKCASTLGPNKNSAPGSGV